MARDLPHPDRRRRRGADRRRGRDHLRGARRPRRGVRLRPGPVAHAAADLDGLEQRRQYSICAAAGGRPRSACARSPTGCSRAGWSATSGRATSRRTDPERRFSRRRRCEGGRHLWSRPAPESRRCCRSRNRARRRRRGDAALRQPDQRTVMFAEELADLKNRYGPAARSRARALPRTPRRRAVLGPARRRPAAAAAHRAGAGRTVDHVWLCGPHAMLLGRRRRCWPSSAYPGAGAPRAVLRRRAATGAAPRGRGGQRRDQRGHRRAGRADHHGRAAT